MSRKFTNLTAVLEALTDMPADFPLVFETSHGPIGGGYHVTELKQASITSIDCGGNISNFDESVLQLLDGSKGAHMSVGKFRSIVGKSIEAVDGLGAGALSVEFGHKNAELRRYQIGDLRQGSDMVGIYLGEGRATCKPRDAAIAACCAPVRSATGCCA